LRIFLVFFLFAISLYAKTPYEKGRELYLEKGCFSCHGNKAEGLHNYPYLANRAKGYLAYKLKRFRDKISENQQQDMMIPFALDLSDDDIENLTTFFAEYRDEEFGESYNYSHGNEGDGGS
jgi:cytochrome c553